MLSPLVPVPASPPTSSLRTEDTRLRIVASPVSAPPVVVEPPVAVALEVTLVWVLMAVINAL
ncbi:hypothetical protein D3C77_774620 [compost metagenome]